MDNALFLYIRIAYYSVLCILIGLACVLIGLACVFCFRLRRICTYICASLRMDCDHLIDEILHEGAKSSERTDAKQAPKRSEGISFVAAQRDRLVTLVSGGQAKRYLGKNVTMDELDNMSDEDIERLYSRYEARLGAQMTNTLGKAALRAYSVVASMFLPIPPANLPQLAAELETDPIVEHALNSTTCELYHRYGMYLAPLTIALSTAKYCSFRHTCPPRNDEEDDGSNGDSGGDGQGDSSRQC